MTTLPPPAADNIVTFDNIAPNTSIDSNPANPTSSTSAAFTFSGTDTGTGVASFECDLGGGGFSACTSPKNYSGLAEGSHTFQVRAIDNAGNTDPTPASFTWVVDTVAPDTSILSHPSDPAASTSAAFTFSGTDTGGSGVAGFECDLDAGGFSACTSPQNYSSLADGSHTFQVRAIDNTGNTDPTPASFTWVVDVAAPTVVVSSTTASPTNVTPVSVTITFSESVTGFTPSVAAGDLVITNGTDSNPAGSGTTYTFDLTPSGQGAVTVLVPAGSAQDAVSNFNTVSNLFSITYDTIAPDTTITGTPPNPSASSNVAFAFSGSDLGGTGVAGFECKLDGGGFSACTSPQLYTISTDGSHTFQVRARDNAGNVDATPASYTWVTDTTGPDTVITASSI